MCFLGYTSSLSRPNRTQVTEGFKRVFIECSFSEQRSHMEVFIRFIGWFWRKIYHHSLYFFMTMKCLFWTKRGHSINTTPTLDDRLVSTN